MYEKETKRIKALSVKIVALICLSNFVNAQAQEVFEERTSQIETSYLESKDELGDYILDTGDILNIEFINAPELSSLFPIDEQGASRIIKSYFFCSFILNKSFKTKLHFILNLFKLASIFL